jgi:hypothetical protein
MIQDEFPLFGEQNESMCTRVVQPKSQDNGVMLRQSYKLTNEISSLNSVACLYRASLRR